MLFSDALKTLTVASNATATTTEPSYSVSYLDTVPTGLAQSSGLITGKTNAGDGVGALTGAVAVTVVGALPTDALARQITNVTVFNRDTVSHTITAKKLVSATGYTVAQAVLAAGESMVYDGAKWSVFSANGELKTSTLGASTSTPGTKNGATVTATEGGTGVVHQTTLTLAATPITMRDTEQGGGVKVYDFPEGRILVLGATASIAVTTTSVLADTLNGGVTCNWGVGTTTQASATVATTEQDIVQVAAFTSSATVNVPGATATGAGVLAAFDGTATAKDAYLNLAVAGAGDIDANATVTVNGTITMTWINLGDV